MYIDLHQSLTLLFHINRGVAPLCPPSYVSQHSNQWHRRLFLLASSFPIAAAWVNKHAVAAESCMMHVNGGLNNEAKPRGGGGAPPLWKVIGTCSWTGYVFAGHQYWHRVSNRPNVVITIGTGYQIGLMWSSPLTQGIKIGLRFSQDRVPIVL